jgi:hypothetical protein
MPGRYVVRDANGPAFAHMLMAMRRASSFVSIFACRDSASLSRGWGAERFRCYRKEAYSWFSTHSDARGSVLARAADAGRSDGQRALWVTLRFVHEVRGEGEYFSGIPDMKLPAEMMKLAQHIIHTKAAAFDPAMLEDHYRNAIVRILRKKHAKLPAASAPVAPSNENVVNLMDALRRSFAAEPPVKKPEAASKCEEARTPPAPLNLDAVSASGVRIRCCDTARRSSPTRS